ncbi:MAG: AMP-binding protein, partial [Candidatus Thermoplasmatota archaeon]|nr:AMP-binding protein [Candidatus Thermoplasmatota archaeon]
MPAPEGTTLPERFQASLARHGDLVAMRVRTDEGWQPTTYAAMGEAVRRVSLGLQARGLEPGDRVGILATNGPAWAVTDWGALHAGVVPVPLYDSLTPDEMAFILEDAGAKVLFVEGQGLYEHIQGVLGKLDALEEVILFEAFDGRPDALTTLEALQDEGERFGHAHPEAFEARWRAVDPEDLATLIYTSGTTGDPKGVMLSHRNLTSNIQAGLGVIPLEAGETYLSFLPLSHSFERVLGHFASYWIGA